MLEIKKRTDNEFMQTIIILSKKRLKKEERK